MPTLNVPANVRLGRVKVYVAPTGTADPVLATMPTGAWTYMGWMTAATALMATTGSLELNVDDLIVPVDTVLNMRAQGIDGSFAEFVSANLAAVWGGTLTSVASGGGVSGYDLLTLKSADDIPRKAVSVEQLEVRELAPGSSLPTGRLRIYFPYATIQPNGNVELSRKKEAGIPFAIRAHPAQDGSETLSKTYMVTAGI